jgi:hypothetical protein
VAKQVTVEELAAQASISGRDSLEQLRAKDADIARLEHENARLEQENAMLKAQYGAKATTPTSTAPPPRTFAHLPHAHQPHTPNLWDPKFGDDSKFSRGKKRFERQPSHVFQ